LIEEKKKIIVTIEEVEKAMQKLNSGKAADEYGITAEHVKFAGSKIYTQFKLTLAIWWSRTL
jgi:hypothetical protein